MRRGRRAGQLRAVRHLRIGDVQEVAEERGRTPDVEGAACSGRELSGLADAAETGAIDEREGADVDRPAWGGRQHEDSDGLDEAVDLAAVESAVDGDPAVDHVAQEAETGLRCGDA